jgi:hypothetical protein
MGYQTALGIAETDISLSQQVSWHFSSNCYPPVPQLMVPVAVKAIEQILYSDGGELIQLPEGVSFRGETELNAYTIVENLHLWAFVHDNLEGEDE